MLTQLSVRLNGIPVGILEEIDQHEMRFHYLDGVVRPISLSLPIEESPFGHLACESYFGGLLPEGVEAKKAIGRKFDVNPNSTFSLLSAIGHDCAGAVSLHLPESPVEADDVREVRVKKISSKQLEKHIIELPKNPLFIGVSDLRLSLAGVQEKAAVCVVDGSVCLALDGTPTTHILKPAIPNYPDTVQNEYLCMRSAKRLGIAVPNVDIRQAGSQIYLLVERYDRHVDAGGRICRLHQEDFCQALGNREKYERYYGPSLEDCFELTYDFACPAFARNALMEIVVFNFLIGNMDAHGKNFAAVYDERWKIGLSPFYDLLCTQVYKELTPDMSMRIGDHFEHSKITVSDWQSMCKSIGFSFPALRKVVQRQTEMLPSEILEERKLLKEMQFDSPIVDEILNQVKRNCRRLRNI